MIIEPFNAVFWVLIAIGALLIILPYHLLKNTDEKKKEKYIYIISGINFVLYLIYKISLFFDLEYIEVAGDNATGIFDVIPLQLCNINLLLVPIGLLTKNNSVKGFSFFVAPLAAFMPLVVSLNGFTGYPIFTFRVFGYYVTHLLVIVASASLGTLGLYKPEVKSLPKILLTMALLSVSIHGVNLIIRSTLCPAVNYFYTCDPAGVSALEFFWNLIPVPYVYELPMVFILIDYMFLVCLVYKLIMKGKNRRKEAVSE